MRSVRLDECTGCAARARRRPFCDVYLTSSRSFASKSNYARVGGTVIVAVIVVGVFNLVLGFAVAVIWDQPSFRALIGLPPRIRFDRNSADNQEDAQPDSAPAWLMTNQWRNILERLTVQTEDPAEAAWWVTLDIIENQRQSLVPLLAHDRSWQLDHAQDGLEQWHDTQRQGRVELRGVANTVERAGLAEIPHTNHLYTALQDYLGHAAADDSTQEASPVEDQQVDTPDVGAAETSDGEHFVDAALILSEMHRELDTLHAMRDQTLEWLSRDAIDKSKFDNIPGKLRIDFATKLYNRAGLEYVVRQFYADTSGDEIASLMVCDVDDCGSLNEQWGVVTTDLVLAQLARELDGSIRKERGFDRVARLGGQTLAMFLGYTDLDGAARFADRWRLRVANTEFQWGESTVSLTISLAIARFDFHRTLAENLDVATRGLAAAREEGRNLGKRIEGDEITTIETDEPAPETRSVVIESEDLPNGGCLIPMRP